MTSYSLAQKDKNCARRQQKIVSIIDNNPSDHSLPSKQYNTDFLMKPSFLKLWLAAVLALLQEPATGFLSVSDRVGGACWRRKSSFELAAASPLNEEADITEMNNLIESLSLEEDDDLRRKRVAELFAKKYCDIPFCSLFDQQLIVMGDVVKKQAAEKMPDPPASADGESKSEEPDGEQSTQQEREKSAEEKQLWALVDMMIQSKTIVKKSRDADAQKSS